MTVLNEAREGSRRLVRRRQRKPQVVRCVQESGQRAVYIDVHFVKERHPADGIE
jgi:hypothetical protein